MNSNSSGGCVCVFPVKSLFSFYLQNLPVNIFLYKQNISFIVSWVGPLKPNNNNNHISLRVVTRKCKKKNFCT